MSKDRNLRKTATPYFQFLSEPTDSIDEPLVFGGAKVSNKLLFLARLLGTNAYFYDYCNENNNSACIINRIGA
jgi:hypothetical protein